MRINTKKTKEMLICFDMIGVRINDKLTWDQHVDHIVKKAQKRLFSLTMLRRAKVSPKDIVKVYCARVRPVLEYASPVWHGGLTEEQRNSIEHVQERALRIAYPGLDYGEALGQAHIPRLCDRRHIQCKTLFEKMQDK